MNAYAIIKGSNSNPEIYGKITFRQMDCEVLVTVNISGLSPTETNIHGLHIHSGTECSGDSSDDFKNALGHFDPADNPHPMHEGDLPPLFASCGKAYMQFTTDRFKVCDIIGKVIVLHSSYDDFMTQPSGNSGEKIACGKICRW